MKWSSSTVLKLLGIVTMTIDHIGAIFFPEQALWRLIGRTALPLFLFGIVEGSRHTQHHGNYILRLIICGLIAQPVYAYLFEWDTFNICFSLALYLATFYGLTRADHRIEQILVLSAAFTLSFVLPLDYGTYGLLYALILWAVREFSLRNKLSTARQAFWFIAAALLFHLTYFGLGYALSEPSMFWHAFSQGFSLLGILCLGATFLFSSKKDVTKLSVEPAPIEQSPEHRSSKKSFLSRYIFYIYYPLHLAIIAAIYAWF